HRVPEPRRHRHPSRRPRAPPERHLRHADLRRRHAGRTRRVPAPHGRAAPRRGRPPRPDRRACRGAGVTALEYAEWFVAGAIIAGGALYLGLCAVVAAWLILTAWRTRWETRRTDRRNATHGVI